MRLRIGLAIWSSLLAAACGLGVVGSGTLDGGVIGEDADGVPGQDAGTEPEASADAAVDAPIDVDAGACTSASTVCTAALVAGWKPIAFATDRAATCPAGYTTTDLVTNPLTADGACTCACTIAANDPPTCSKGSFTAMIGSSTCPNTGATYTVNGGGCTALAAAGSLSQYAKYSPLPLTPGTCTSSTKKDATKLTTTAVRACEPPPACAEDVCLGSGLSPFGSCIAHDGDVACPAGPFLNKTLAGPSATLTCGGCTTCPNTATCGPATLRFYNDGACATELASRLVNGACNTVSGTAGAAVTHFKYEAATTNPVCTPANNPTKTAALDTPRTICCR